MELQHQILEVTTEYFASPLNVHKNTKRYCSKFARGAISGASRQAYDGPFKGIFEINPGYTPSELDKALKWALASAQTELSVLGIAIYPEWIKSAEVKRMVKNDPIIHLTINIPQIAQFDFAAPDHLTSEKTLQKGTHARWGVRILLVANKKGYEQFVFPKLEELKKKIPEIQKEILTN